jgi:hypothetical protein
LNKRSYHTSSRYWRHFIPGYFYHGTHRRHPAPWRGNFTPALSDSSACLRRKPSFLFCFLRFFLLRQKSRNPRNFFTAEFSRKPLNLFALLVLLRHCFYAIEPLNLPFSSSPCLCGFVLARVSLCLFCEFSARLRLAPGLKGACHGSVTSAVFGCVRGCDAYLRPR